MDTPGFGTTNRTTVNTTALRQLIDSALGGLHGQARDTVEAGIYGLLAAAPESWEADRWWRVIHGEQDKLWCETSDPREAREALEDHRRSADCPARLQRLRRTVVRREWLDVPASA